MADGPGVLIYAPPASGKTTLIEAIIEAGGYAVDTDTIIRLHFPAEWRARVWRTDPTWWPRMTQIVLPVFRMHIERGAVAVTNGTLFYRQCRQSAGRRIIVYPGDPVAQVDRLMARSASLGPARNTDTREYTLERMVSTLAKVCALLVDHSATDEVHELERYLSDVPAVAALIPR